MNFDTGNRCPSQLDLPVPTAIPDQPPDPEDHIGPGSWANREENFAGALLHYEDDDLKYVEIQVRLDGPVADLVAEEKELRLTFEGHNVEIKVWDSMDPVTRSQIAPNDTFDITANPFVPFSIFVEGLDSGLAPAGLAY